MPQPHQRRRPQNRRASGPNKSQQREAAVRAEQMAADPSPDVLGALVEPGVATEVIEAAVAPVQRAPRTEAASRGGSRRRREDARPRAGGGGGGSPTPVVSTISHAQEYAFIRADLRRLLITAGAVLVLMLALLFFIEG
jgi:hypothetical protein